MGAVDESAREYLERTLLLPSLEVGLEEMLRTCTAATEAGQKTDAINFLATWMMRNNPRHNPEALRHMQAQRAAAKQRAARQAAAEAEVARRVQEAADWAARFDPPTLELKHPFGSIVLAVDLASLPDA